jgi:hypothetical protein
MRASSSRSTSRTTSSDNLVGSRRPTVSLALRSLAEEGRLTRLDEHRWLLTRAAIAP